VTQHNEEGKKGRGEGGKRGRGNQQHLRPWCKVTQHNPARRKKGRREEGKKAR